VFWLRFFYQMSGNAVRTSTKKRSSNPSRQARPVVAMTVAGSDSGGGAGIQADLKTFAALGVYGTSALTAVTAQNTVEVRRAMELPPELIASQIDAVIDDIGVEAAKTGMLASSAVIEIVAEKVAEHGVEKLIVDPVMVAKSGDRLLQEEAISSLIRRLLPLAMVVTPNLPEAERLVEFPVEDPGSMRRAAEAIVEMGARSAVIKGGHGKGEESVDLLYTGKRFRWFRARRLDSRNTHGTGCTFSAAITAQVALGWSIEKAVELAKAYLSRALAQGVDIGKGHGPVGHFAGCRLWQPASRRR
jgi:hydroxymethylpyrimidine/phosphomethylpyrimidine kinase